MTKIQLKKCPKYYQNPKKMTKIPLKPKNDQSTFETQKMTKISPKPKKK